MQYREYRPAPDLRPFVDRYWTLTGDAMSGDAILPDGHSELIAHLDTPPSRHCEPQAACLWIGQMTAPVEIAPAKRTHVFGVRFHPHGAAAFAAVPQHELRDRLIPADAILGAAAWRWREQLADGLDPVSATDGFLRTKRLRRAPDARLAMPLDGAMRVRDMASALCWSPRQLERACQACIGLSPKVMLRLHRFQLALRLRRRGSPWAEVAAASHYFDQSHLIADFRQFAASSPLELEHMQTELGASLVRDVAFFQDRGGAGRLR